MKAESSRSQRWNHAFSGFDKKLCLHTCQSTTSMGTRKYTCAKTTKQSMPSLISGWSKAFSFYPKARTHEVHWFGPGWYPSHRVFSNVARDTCLPPWFRTACGSPPVHTFPLANSQDIRHAWEVPGAFSCSEFHIRCVSRNCSSGGTNDSFLIENSSDPVVFDSCEKFVILFSLPSKDKSARNPTVHRSPESDPWIFLHQFGWSFGYL